MTLDANKPETAATEPHHKRPRRSRHDTFKAVALLALVLAAGAVIGAGGTLLFLKRKMRPQQPSAEKIGQSIITRLNEVVTLSPEERTRLEDLVRAHMSRVDEVRRDSLRAIRKEFDDMNDKVDDLIGPDRSRVWEADKEKRYGKYYRGKHERHTDFSRRERVDPPR